MPVERSPDLTLSRRAFVGVLAGGLVGGLLSPEAAQAQPADTAPPTALDPVQAAEVKKLQAETESIEEETERKNSALGRASEFLGPVATFATGLVALGSLTVGARQWLHEKRAEAAVARNEQLNRISNLLHSKDLHERENGAEQLVMTMAHSTSETDQLQVYQMARSALRRRTLPATHEGPIRLSDYERNIIEAFRLVLPAVRRSRMLHREAYMGREVRWDDSLDAEGVNLSGAKLFGWNLTYVHLSRSNLEEARLQNGILNCTNLNGCNLQRTHFIHLADTETNFDEILLQNADLRGAIFRAEYFQSEKLFIQVARRAANIKGLILLGGVDMPLDDQVLNDRIRELESRGAIYVPHGSEQYPKYYDMTRTPPPESLTNLDQADQRWWVKAVYTWIKNEIMLWCKK